jgi:hypothetical protein
MDLMEKEPINKDNTVANFTNMKAEIRRGTATSLGIKVEEMLDSAEKKAAELGGAKKAMQGHAKNLLGIMAAVDDEVEKSIPDLETAKLIKSWLSKTVAATENLAGHLSNIEQQALGEAQGYRVVHDFIQKIVREIDSRQEELVKAIAEGRITLEEDGTPQMADSGPRPPGVRPGASIAQQRKQEEQAGKPKRGRKKD